MALFDRTSERLRRVRALSPGFADSAGGQGLPGIQPASAPHLSLPPGGRDLRAQAVHRLQIGLFGLAAMLLLVSLANVIQDRVLTSDRSAVATQVNASPSASASPASDPLVDLGVAPEVPVNGAGADHKTAKPAH